jgi:hypothetical protein
MIQNRTKQVNTFYKQNVLMTPMSPVPRKAAERSIQQAATHRAYENKKPQ